MIYGFVFVDEESFSRSRYAAQSAIVSDLSHVCTYSYRAYSMLRSPY